MIFPFFSKSHIKSIGPLEAKEMIASGNIIIIDVRSSDMFGQAHIDGAILGGRSNWEAHIENIDRSKRIICYCYEGISSKSYCRKLKRAGFEHVYNLKGGFDAWKKCPI